METNARTRFNKSFTDEGYQLFLDKIAARYNHKPIFRIAESPVFIPKALGNRLIEACEMISDDLRSPEYQIFSDGALNAAYNVPGETPHSLFLQMDFAITKNPEGELWPQLIEVQGFPSLYFYQDLVAHEYRNHFDIPDNYTHLFGLDSQGYLDRLRKAILGDHQKENVILLEIEPDTQVTRIDFLAAHDILGVPILCVKDVKAEGRDLYYVNESGQKIGIERIFNRVIFDELIRKPHVRKQFNFTEEYDVSWAGHPNWFFRISKYTLPFLRNPYVPETYFLKDLQDVPDDLDNYVLKPLFSFSGTGVVYHVNRDTLKSISEDPANYVLQRKIEYAPVVQAPDGLVKCEVRMLMLWEPEHEKPEIINNLARLSRGEMIGVRYNKDKTWVGGSVGFFEQ